MHSRYAVERRCSHRRERFQLAFAQAAMNLIPRYEDTAYEPSGAGLLILGETELALEKPITRLRQAYGDDVQFDPPVVRYQRGRVLMEPHMGLRVICNPQHFAPVRRDLSMRGALLLDSEITEQFGVVRASAPLAALIGYPRRLADQTDPRTRLVMWPAITRLLRRATTQPELTP